MIPDVPMPCILLSILMVDFSIENSVPACDSEIFCYGPLLDAAQKAYVYNDSKSFVDMKLNSEAESVLSDFSQLSNANGGNLSDYQIKTFVHDNFSPPGFEFMDWTPLDWKEDPAFLSNISDSSLREWAFHLHSLWKVLGRQIKDDVKFNSSLYSLIPVDDPFIVPGGRFREFYYWDTYWVMKGLLISEMTATVKGMLQNMLAMVNQFDFVPNGGRIYYQRRSQPPFLIPMTHAFIKATGDLDFLTTALPVLEREYNFWMTERCIVVGDYKLNQYASDVNQPRPESYREDNQAIKNKSQENGEYLMTAITSACESGWDFSTRWAGKNYDCQSNVIEQLITRDIIPVDLNSILAMNERSLAEFNRILDNEDTAVTYDQAYNARMEAIEALLWDEADGIYYDYVISSGQRNNRYFASNLNPLWTKCFPEGVDTKTRESRMFEYLQSNGILDYPGGIPTSLYHSGEQWDFPNAWPPLVHMIIEGMKTSSNQSLQDEAFVQAQKWINSNYNAFVKTSAMFEKYDVTTEEGVPGSGGEYDVQEGFGWTNGVILTLLDFYGDRAYVEKKTSTSLPDDVAVTSVEMTTGKASSSHFIPTFILMIFYVLCCVLIVDKNFYVLY